MATPMICNPYFDAEKKRVLTEKNDSSRKGNIDAPITDLIYYINCISNYYTTSSCSGRIIIFNECSDKKKEGCQWLLVSHEIVQQKVVSDALMKLSESSSSGYVYFKFESFILHLACKSLEDAQKMLHVAVSTGFKNSGFSVSKKNKIIVAVRSTLSLEVPIAFNGAMIVTQEYMTHLVHLANEKMEENFRRIARFFDAIKNEFDVKPPPPPQVEDEKDLEINGLQKEQQLLASNSSSTTDCIHDIISHCNKD